MSGPAARATDLRPGRSAPAWPSARLLGGLAPLALGLAGQELLAPSWTAHLGPAVLAVATLVVGGLVLRHGNRLDPAAAVTWRCFALIAALLAVGQGIRALGGVGVNPTGAGPSDLALAATGPVAVVLCARLVRSTGGRIRAQVVLDAAVALTALGVLVEMLVPAAVGRSAAAAPLLTVGYPAVSAVLCAVGLVTFASVSAPRRPAAGWLLVGFASLAVAMAAGALATGGRAPVLDVVTSTGYLAMLLAAMLALAADPGPAARAAEPVAEMPLIGVVVSYCVSSGVVLLLLVGWIAGRPPTTPEAATVIAAMLLTVLRTLLWAADGARLTRQVLRTEAFFRTLVDRAADLTIVLDGGGRITWASDAAEGPRAWSPRDLEGRPLAAFLHPEDLTELHRTLDPAAVDDGPAVVLRLRTRDGGWRRLETVRTASSAGLARGAGGGDGWVLHLREVVGRRSTELELERMAYTDYLTGLPNRARLMTALDTARTRVAAGAEACLLLLDLDGFKPVNDVAGHDAGDELLVQVAGRLRTTVRDHDLVSRLGGDEFAVLVPAGLEEATALAERIVAQLRGMRASTAGRATELVLAVSGSVGVAALDPADDVTTTIRHADVALRAAKAAGKGCVRRHSAAVDDGVARRARLAHDLPAAIEDGRLRLVFQPVVGVEERRILGVEALVRWEHPLLGPVPPEEFVGLAEDDGLIVPLQRWVLGAATAALAPLLAEGRDLQLGVNVSVRHLQAGCLAPDVARALTESGVPPQRLMVELTESVLMSAEDRFEGDLSTLREMGCLLSLDDFGRGYSSMARLARLPVDVLKMDRDFVAHIDTDVRTAALVGSVVDLGGTLGLDVVAEGVETPGQLAALRLLGCRFLQGHLLGRPVPAEELRDLVDGFDPAVLDEPARPTERVAAVH